MHVYVCVDALMWGTNVFEGVTIWSTDNSRNRSSGANYLLLDNTFISDLSKEGRLTDLGAPGPRY